MHIKKLSMFTISTLVLAIFGCAGNSKYFGDQPANYNNAKTVAPIQLSKKSLQPTNRYFIPKISSKWKEDPKLLTLPPDYLKKDNK